MIPSLSIGPRRLLNDCNHSATAIFWRSAIECYRRTNKEEKGPSRGIEERTGSEYQAESLHQRYDRRLSTSFSVCLPRPPPLRRLQQRCPGPLSSHRRRRPPHQAPPCACGCPKAPSGRAVPKTALPALRESCSTRIVCISLRDGCVQKVAYGEDRFFGPHLSSSGQKSLGYY